MIPNFSSLKKDQKKKKEVSHYMPKIEEIFEFISIGFQSGGSFWCQAYRGMPLYKFQLLNTV